ncbi:3629_t:CDS:2, partial [Cetraspora pellucida]
MFNSLTKQRVTAIATLIFNQNNKRWLVYSNVNDDTKDNKPTELKVKKKVNKPQKPVPYLLLKDTHSIDDDTLKSIMTNRSFPRIKNDLFTLVVRPWREKDFYYTKKTKEPITTYRLQTVVSKKIVSKLATVRNRIKRRIREAARYSLPVVGRARHDYLFLASLNVYNAPWKELCIAVENATGNPKLYKTWNYI